MKNKIKKINKLKMSYKEIQKRKNLTSRILQLQVDRFVSNKNNRIIMPARPYRATVNINGFIEVLNGAKQSNNRETLESIMPKEVDLSIKQNGGFSVFLWLHISKKKTPKKKGNPSEGATGEDKKEEKNICYIFKKGGTVDQFTPSIGLSGKQENLFIELSTSKSKKETLYANKKIEENHLYSIGISFAINYEDDTTNVSLFIDGKLDTQSSIPGEPIHNQGSVFFGKPDSSTAGFKGTVADVMMVPSAITEQEVNLAHTEGLKNLYDSNGAMLGMNTVFAEIFKRKKLINKYAFYTKKSVYEIENLCLSNAKMLEIVKNYDDEERKNDIRPPPEKINYKREIMIHKMTEFLSDIDNRILCNKIDINGKLINTCFFLANQGEENLEIDRVINIFDTLSEVLLFSVTKPFILELAKILYADMKEYEDDSKKKIKEIYIKTRTFFINLKVSLDTLDKNEREVEEENAKYLKGKKKANRSIYSTLRRTRPENSDPLPLEETRGFGNCIPEHEVLLLKTQNIKNSIDIEQEENLPQYHSTFIIKTLYEKPKNLPGEDPECPEPKILSTSMSSEDNEEFSSNNENTINESFQNPPNPNTTSSINNQNDNRRKPKDIDFNAIHQFVLKIFDEEEKTFKAPEIGSVVNEDTAELIQKAILDAKIEEERKREEEENKKISETIDKDKKVDEKKQETNEIVEYSFDPDPPKDWSSGNFELIINHCYNCQAHQKTTRGHYEFRFVDKFNEIGDAVKNVFQNAVIIGNLDEQEYLSNFDVYLRNTGLPCDAKGRYVVYCKRDTLKFPTVTDVLDKLVCLSIMYGSSMNVEKAQSEDLKSGISKCKQCHEYPYPLPEKLEKIKQKVLAKVPEQKIDPERTKFFCENHGCNKEYVENQNKGKSTPCCYHPGVYQFGSYNGAWPECWTCCEKKWDAPGCKRGKHRGVLLEKRLMLCVNHGEVNPETGRPDSACGTWYTSRSVDGCSYHSGYLKKEKGQNYQYTCCGGGDGSNGCVTGEHKTANYPEQEAKLYFYPKLLDNPGLRYEKKEKKEGDDQPKNRTAELIKSCGFFKEIQEYPDYEQLSKARTKKMEEEEKLDRYCFNWGCGKIFKDENNGDNSCRCHPGKWDHGFSGTTTVKFIAMKNENLELWKPHWTCCRGDWNSKPCKKCKHHGPLTTDLKYYDMRYKYPDQRMKLRFKRVVGDKWMSYLEKFIYDEGQVRRICKKFWDGSRKSLSDMPNLCDKLKLNLLVLQEDPSYIMKFWDIVNKNETCAYFSDKEGTVDMEKFIKWWFMEYEDIYNELHPLKKKEDKKNKKEEEKSATAV